MKITARQRRAVWMSGTFSIGIRTCEDERLEYVAYQTRYTVNARVDRPQLQVNVSTVNLDRRWVNLEQTGNIVRGIPVDNQEQHC